MLPWLQFFPCTFFLRAVRAFRTRTSYVNFTISCINLGGAPHIFVSELPVFMRAAMLGSRL